MVITATWAKFDINAKNNSSPSIGNIQPFSSADDLKRRKISPLNAATVGELNQCVLDGEQTIFPANTVDYHWGVWSDSLCADDCTFEQPPILTVNFSEPVSSGGISFDFFPPTDDFCRDLNIKWFDSDGNLLAGMDFNPDSASFFCEHQVDAYSRIIVTFRKMCRPQTFLKLSSIYYGQIVVLSERDFIKNKLIILEEVSPYSEKLSINTANCTVFANDGDFNFVSNPKKFALIKERQKIQYLKDTEDYGTYFIDSIISDNYKTLELKQIDFIGVLEKSKFYGGIYENVPFSDIVLQIAEQAQTELLFDGEHNGFDIPSDIAKIPLTGYIPITDCRRALHIICFAAGVYADCSRGEKAKIKRIAQPTQAQSIGPDRLVRGKTEIKMRTPYSGCSLPSVTYTLTSDTRTIVEQEYEAGTQTIEFSEPYSDIKVSGAELTESHTNYAVIKLTTTAKVTITGKPYSKTVKTFTKNAENISSTKANLKEFSENTMMHPDYAQARLNMLFDYYMKKYQITFQTLGNDTVSDYVTLADVTGNIEKQQIQLLSGCITDGMVV